MGCLASDKTDGGAEHETKVVHALATWPALVPRHSDYDWLILSQSRIGKSSGATGLASGNAWLTANEAISFEGNYHLVDRGRADLKVPLHVGLGGWASEHVRIGVDEGQILALPFGEAVSAGAARGA
jgi:hypothetical protein